MPLSLKEVTPATRRKVQGIKDMIIEINEDGTFTVNGRGKTFDSVDFESLKLWSAQLGTVRVTVQQVPADDLDRIEPEEIPLCIHGQGSYEHHIMPSDVLG